MHDRLPAAGLAASCRITGTLLPCYVFGSNVELARVVANIEVTEVLGNEVGVRANVVIYEDNLRGETVWAARNEYRLRMIDGTFRLVRKKVALVNNEKPIYTLSFLV